MVSGSVHAFSNSAGRRLVLADSELTPFTRSDGDPSVHAIADANRWFRSSFARETAQASSPDQPAVCPSVRPFVRVRPFIHSFIHSSIARSIEVKEERKRLVAVLHRSGSCAGVPRATLEGSLSPEVSFTYPPAGSFSSSVAARLPKRATKSLG